MNVEFLAMIDYREPVAGPVRIEFSGTVYHIAALVADGMRR
ncbi:MAG: hypothetical protein R8K50_00760 [Mariprofundus sp.]